MMGEIRGYLSAIIVGAVLVGCSTTSQWVMAKSQSARNDVFREVGDQEAIPEGHVHLEIIASIKTHSEGYFLLEPMDSLHGKKGYPFVLNIDGQAVVWKVDGQEETTPRYLEKGGRNPEGGTGVYYKIRKKIRIASDSHRLFFGLPEEDYYREFDVKLKEGKTFALVFDPVYKRGISKKQRNFKNGLDWLEKDVTETCP